MLNIDNIILKYINSSEKWLLAIPVIENGQIKLRCYMTNKNELVGTFQNCYTYDVEIKTLIDFYSHKSHGQAYNNLIKYKKVRTGFFNEKDHEKGFWSLSDIKQTILNGKSKLLCEAINHYMNLTNRNFIIEPITEIEKQELVRLEEEAINLGYDY